MAEREDIAILLRQDELGFSVDLNFGEEVVDLMLFSFIDVQVFIASRKGK